MAVTMADLLDHPLARRVGEEFRANPRARWLLAAVGLIVLVSAILGLSDRIDAARADFAQRARHVARLETVAKETEWPDRRATAEALRAQLDGRLWSADTDGLALADFQDWIALTGRESVLTLSEVRPEIDPGANNPAGLRKMSANVAGAFDASALERFLAAVAQHNRIVVVDKLRIQTTPTPRFDMTLTTFMRPRGADPAKASPAVRAP